MMTDQNKHDDLFAARVSLGLRELDGVESAPDVAESVARRLAEPDPRESRSRTSWLTIAAALLGVAVTATLLTQPDWGNRNDPASEQSQDPKGPWRLVYELPIDELQRSLRGNQSADLEQALDSCVTSVANRLGAHGVVARSGVTSFTVELDDASPESVAQIRRMVESLGKLEMRMLAYEDYRKDGVQFDIARETKQLHEWLDAGGRERMLADHTAISGYRAISKHLKWVVHRIRPKAARPGRWPFRYSDMHMGGVFVSGEADWNSSVIPAHMKAKPIAEQFVLEVLPVNLHDVHFTGADFDPDSTKVLETPHLVGVYYRVNAERAADYEGWTEDNVSKCYATLWDGELMQAPKFVAKISGPGIISGLGREQAELMVSALASELPALPRLVKSEARNVKK